LAQALRLARVLPWAAARVRAFEPEQVREPVLAWELEPARPLVAAQVPVWVQRPSVPPALSEPLELWVQAALWADLAPLAALRPLVVLAPLAVLALWAAQLQRVFAPEKQRSGREQRV